MKVEGGKLSLPTAQFKYKLIIKSCDLRAPSTDLTKFD